MKSHTSDRNTVFSLVNIFIALAIWSLLILRYGYSFGSGDHVELLPYSLFLNDPSLYPHDFFIQSLHASLPNERTIFANLLRPFSTVFPIAIFCLHLLNTVFLLLGLYKIGQRFFAQKWQTWIPIFCSILIFNDKALGNVDLYTSSIQAGDVACAIIAWTIAFFLDRRYVLMTLLMVIATFIHVLEGLDVMIVLSMILFVFALQKKLEWKIFLSCMAIYASTAFVYLVFLFLAKTDVKSTLSDKALFDILFTFRHPHHFIFSTFPLFNKLFFIPIALIGMGWFYKRNETLFLFFFISLSLLFIYVIASDYGHIILIANFQWYKLTQWLKVLAFIAIFAFLTERFKLDFVLPNTLFYTASFTTVLVCFMLIFLDKSPFNTPYQIGAKAYQYSDIDIAIKARNSTAIDAIFVIPFSNSSFKYWSERSSFIEFKANVRNKAFVDEWYRRIGLVYGLDTTDAHVGFEKHWTADSAFFARASSDEVAHWKAEKITHILSEHSLDNPRLSLVDKNQDYWIYKINE